MVIIADQNQSDDENINISSDKDDMENINNHTIKELQEDAAS